MTEYLIRKSGAWYRPNSAGYTNNIAEAGRYTLAEAEAITHPNGPNGPRDNMSYEPAPPSPIVDEVALPPGCKMHSQSRYASDLDCDKCGLGEGEACREFHAMADASIAAKRAAASLVSPPKAGMGEPVAWACVKCNSPRSVDPCPKCGTPLTKPADGWDWPGLPDIDRIRALAREVGYAIGVHGSLERDLDLIAAPWVESAIGPYGLALHIAAGLGGEVVDFKNQDKPCGRWSCNIHTPDWTKMIDLSVMPPVANHEASGDGVRVTDEMVEAACRAHAPQWEGIDQEIQVYARQQMRAALEAALPPLGDGRAEIVEDSAEGFVAAVVALAEAGIESDIQELLVRGNPMSGIKPNALLNAIEAYNRSLSNPGGGLS